MPTLYAFDAASPAPANVYKQNGAIAVSVYVSGDYAQDANHVKSLRTAGLGPWPNYERGLWELVEATDDRSAGRAAGRQGVSDAKRCGFPADGTVWFPFSLDVRLDPTRYNEAANAFRGIQEENAGQYLISCYGQGGLITYLREQGVIDQKGWLSASSSYPGYDINSSDICIYQEVGQFIEGHNTDRDVITEVQALHAWWPDDSPYLEDDMPSADEVATAVWNKVMHNVDSHGNPSSGNHPAWQWLTLGTANARIAASQTLDQIAAAVLAALPSDARRGITEEQMRAALRSAMPDTPPDAAPLDLVPGEPFD
jgi:hypothetical protein